MSRITHLLTQTLTYALRSGTSASGDPSFGAQATTPCRVESRVDWAARTTGEEFVNSTRVSVEVDIPVGSRVWLPGADTGSADASVPVKGHDNASFPPGGTLYELIV